MTGTQPEMSENSRHPSGHQSMAAIAEDPLETAETAYRGGDYHHGDGGHRHHGPPGNHHHHG